MGPTWGDLGPSEPMPRLSDLPELIGFFSYSREDDEDFDHALSKLRTRIQNELRGQLGRSRESLRLWQDKEAIPPGTLWASEIQAAIGQSVFFIPIVSPRVVRSQYCGIEFDKFLARERELGRSDLVFPILFIDLPELSDKTAEGPEILQTLSVRQYVDWREFRYDPDNPQVRREVAEFCKKITQTLRRIPPQDEADRRRARDAEAAEQAKQEEARARDAQRQQEEAAAEARAREAEARQRAEAAERSRQEAAEERRRIAAARAVPTGPTAHGKDGPAVPRPDAGPGEGWMRWAISAALVMSGAFFAIFGISMGFGSGALSPHQSLPLLAVGTCSAALGAVTAKTPSRVDAAFAVTAMIIAAGPLVGILLFNWGQIDADLRNMFIVQVLSLVVGAVVYWKGRRARRVVTSSLRPLTRLQAMICVWFLIVPICATIYAVHNLVRADLTTRVVLAATLAIPIGILLSVLLWRRAAADRTDKTAWASIVLGSAAALALIVMAVAGF